MKTSHWSSCALAIEAILSYEDVTLVILCLSHPVSPHLGAFNNPALFASHSLRHLLSPPTTATFPVHHSCCYQRFHFLTNFDLLFSIFLFTLMRDLFCLNRVTPLPALKIGPGTIFAFTQKFFIRFQNCIFGVTLYLLQKSRSIFVTVHVMPSIHKPFIEP